MHAAHNHTVMELCTITKAHKPLVVLPKLCKNSSVYQTEGCLLKILYTPTQCAGLLQYAQDRHWAEGRLTGSIESMWWTHACCQVSPTSRHHPFIDGQMQIGRWRKGVTLWSPESAPTPFLPGSTVVVRTFSIRAHWEAHQYRA